MKAIRSLFFLLAFIIPTITQAAIVAGIGKTEITPPIGTPSAGYANRKGAGMQGIHDPLLAIALFIDNGEKQIVLCSVDHLGFTYEMVQDIIHQVHQEPHLKKCEIYIASSHTHSGGGAYLNIPHVGESLAGPYNPETTKLYVNKTAEAIVQSSQNPIPVKIGIGYGKAENLSLYRSLWPTDVTPLSDVTVLKVTHLDDTPLTVLFNYPVHPTVLTSQNRQFSSDFVGYARDNLQLLMGTAVQPIYFNGAQGDINPVIFNEENRFDSCQLLGHKLAETVEKIWNATDAQIDLHIQTQKEIYAFKPEPTPFGLTLPVDSYQTEMNVIVLNESHAFLTVPAELSSLYDQRLKDLGNKLGYTHLSIFGLTNDAHGYIIIPDAWRHKTSEAGLSFGGEFYGDKTEMRAFELLKALSPNK